MAEEKICNRCKKPSENLTGLGSGKDIKFLCLECLDIRLRQTMEMISKAYQPQEMNNAD